MTMRNARFGRPLWILLSLLLIGLILTQIPGALSRLVSEAARTILRLSGG